MPHQLPPPIDLVAAPESYSVTAVTSSYGCRLQAVLSCSKTWHPRLPSGPEAAIGSLVHEVREKWEEGLTSAESPAALFDRVYRETRERLSKDPLRRHFADLEATRTRSDWSRIRRLALGDPTPPVSKPCKEGKSAPKNPAGLRVGNEVDLASISLRLHGRADRIDRAPDRTWVVRDYKTGSALGPDGEIREIYALQMQCYGLMIRDEAPDATVRLILDDGEEHEVLFDRDVEDAVRARVDALLAAMPQAHATVAAASLATPGASCTMCSFRPACATYRKAAPHWWRSYPEDVDRIPVDTWGHVVAVTVKGMPSLILDDAAGRRVSVDRLDSRHELDGVEPGSPLWLFALNAAGRGRGTDGRRYHPRNFYEMPRDRWERRAWTATSYGDLNRPGSYDRPETTYDRPDCVRDRPD